MAVDDERLVLDQLPVPQAGLGELHARRDHFHIHRV